ncbi:MAG: hypothetical protein AAB692_00255, partial [Patescibacteria group bacterium]
MSSMLGIRHYDRNQGYSQDTLQLLEVETAHFIDQGYIAAEDTIAEHRAELEAVAEALLARNKLNKEDLEKLLGPRPPRPIIKPAL